jgi:phage FluMu protein Com
MIEKFGANEKILKTAHDVHELEATRNDVAAENNLVRCSNCQHLIAKKSSAGYVDIQHRKEVILVKNPERMDVLCPRCNTVVKII